MTSLQSGIKTATVSTLTVLLLFMTTTADALNFAVIGDWGMGGYKSGWNFEIRSAAELNHVCEQINCNFTLSVGDNIYVGNVMQGMQDSFEAMFQSKGPFFPSIGNHDNWSPQVEYSKKSNRWRFKSRWYTEKLPIDNTGYTVQIFAVDSTDGSLGGGGQYVWLENELKQSDARCKIIFGHYPTVGSGRHSRVGTVGKIHELMKKYNVQAYFCGHDHILEMSNFQGRVLGLSGAMARGGMMLRGIGGKYRRFTLTHPNEYNKNVQDWPSHGFLTANLSPNVLTIQMYDNFGGIQYEFSVTHDWMKKVPDQAASAENEWPPGDIVLQAYKDEVSLPKGPGGGTIFSPSGEVVNTISTASNETMPPSTYAPTAAPGAPTSPPTTAAPHETIPNLDKVTEKPLTEGAVPGYVKYAVSAECEGCHGAPTIGQPFIVYIHGDSVTSNVRVYLTTNVLGCDLREHPHNVEGTNIVSPVSNAIRFTPTGLATTAYVCYSVDKGKSYGRVVRIDSDFEDASFNIAPPAGTGNGSGTGQTAATAQAPSPTAAPPATPTTTNPNTNTAAAAGGHSTVLMLLVGILCMVGGAGGSIYYNNMKQQQQQGAQRVPTTDDS